MSTTILSPDLIRLRATAGRFLLAFTWVMALSVSILAYFNHPAWMISAGLSFVFALIPTLMYMRDQSGPMTRYAVGGCMTLIWTLLVFNSAGLPDGFILDAHMLFFVMNAIVVSYFCWRSIIILNSIVVTHHLLFAFAFPYYIWPSNDYNFYHLIIHAGYALLAAGSLSWLTNHAYNLFNEAYHSLNQARDAQAAQKQAEKEKKIQQQKQNKLFEEQLSQLASDLDHQTKEALGAISASTQQLGGAALTLRDKAQTTHSQSANSHTLSEETLERTESLASATTELDAGSQEITRIVTHNTDTITQAAERANETTALINALDTGAEKIEEILTMIQAIAEQTNLLALNATIEAARAGEAGKGFAVVASEVKNLANQTASATDQVTGQISQIQGDTQKAVQAIKNIQDSINSVHDNATNITAAIEEHHSALSGISLHISETANSAKTITENITSVQEDALSTLSAAEQVQGASNAINDHARAIQDTIAAFIETLRTQASQQHSQQAAV